MYQSTSVSYGVWKLILMMFLLLVCTDSNELDGTIPTEIGRLTNLEHLVVGTLIISFEFIGDTVLC